MGMFADSAEKRRSPHDPVNIASPEFKANPYPFYARLRAEAPVYRMTLPTGETAWLITRYDDVAMVLRDDRFVKDTSNALTPAQIGRAAMVPQGVQVAEAEHAQSGPSRSYPTPGTREQGVHAPADRADAPAHRGAHRRPARRRSGPGRMDVIRDYALPLPTTIIAEMLGVPAEDRHAFHRWSNAIMSAAASTWAHVEGHPERLVAHPLHPQDRQDSAGPIPATTW